MIVRQPVCLLSLSLSLSSGWLAALLCRWPALSLGRSISKGRGWLAGEAASEEDSPHPSSLAEPPPNGSSGSRLPPPPLQKTALHLQPLHRHPQQHTKSFPPLGCRAPDLARNCYLGGPRWRSRLASPPPPPRRLWQGDPLPPPFLAERPGLARAPRTLHSRSCIAWKFTLGFCSRRGGGVWRRRLRGPLLLGQDPAAACSPPRRARGVCAGSSPGTGRRGWGGLCFAGCVRRRAGSGGGSGGGGGGGGGPPAGGIDSWAGFAREQQRLRDGVMSAGQAAPLSPPRGRMALLHQLPATPALPGRAPK